MQFIDYYKVLGVEPTADEKSIKTAYRKLARQYHPDVNKDAGAEDKFKEIAEAYDVLKNADKRAEFDQLRQYAQQGGNFEVPPNWQSQSTHGSSHFESGGQEGDFSDFFESIFGANRRSGAGKGNGFSFQRTGRDIELELPVFLEEVISGDSKAISYKVPSYDMNGHRQADVLKNLSVKIPKGVISGERIRLKGQGAPGTGGGANGDLYLIIKFAPHPRFDVQGHDLTLSLPVAPWEAALGAKIAVPTLTGQINVNIPANSQAGQKFRIKGKGLPTKKLDEVGDLYVMLKIVMPPTLTEEAKVLWKELAEKDHFDPRANEGKS